MIEKLRDPEFRAALPFAVVGAVAGSFRYYIQPELTARRAWAGLALGVLAYDIAAPNDETMSQGANRAFEANKLAVGGLITYTSLHLAGALPDRVDFFKHGLSAIKG